MKLKKIFKELYVQGLELDFEIKEFSKEQIQCFCYEKTSKEMGEKNIFVGIIIDNKGVSILFGCDKIERNLENYYLINRLNTRACYVIAHISDEDDFVMYFDSHYQNEKDASDLINKTLYHVFLSDDAMTLIKPILDKTYPAPEESEEKGKVNSFEGSTDTNDYSNDDIDDE